LPHATKNEIRKELVQLVLVWVMKCGGEKMPLALQGGLHHEGEMLSILGLESMVRQCLDGQCGVWCEPKDRIFGDFRSLIVSRQDWVKMGV
jgi:hypothetical protein